MGETIEVDGVTIPIGTHAGKGILLCADHRGYPLKEAIKKKLKQKGFEVADIGTFSAERCDHPPLSDKVGKKLSEEYDNKVGIAICGSGIGILMVAAKYSNVFAARCTSPTEAINSRLHNNTNLIGIGADYMSEKTALTIIEAWLTTPFHKGPHADITYAKRYAQQVRLSKNIA